PDCGPSSFCSGGAANSGCKCRRRFMTRKYLIIAPCRDEAKFMRRTLDSIAIQTLKPECVVVVDDGSSDDTPKILAEYAAKYPFIKVVTRSNRGKRSVGPGVIDAFYAGLDTV